MGKEVRWEAGRAVGRAVGWAVGWLGPMEGVGGAGGVARQLPRVSAFVFVLSAELKCKLPLVRSSLAAPRAWGSGLASCVGLGRAHPYERTDLPFA